MELTFIDVVELNDELIELIRRWRNSDHVRKNMLTKRYITREEHKKFIETLKKERDKRRMWMFFYAGEPAGIVTIFDIDYLERRANWGVYIGEKKFLSRGLGKRAILFLLERAFGEYPVDLLHTKVLKANQPAIRLYERLGFERIEDLRHRHNQEETITYVFPREKWVRLFQSR